MKRKVILILLLIVIIPVSLFCFPGLYKENQEIARKREILDRRKRDWERLSNILKYKVRRFKGTVGLVVEDMDTQWRISFNEDTLLPSASLVKIPIMLSCFYAAEDGKIKMDDVLTLKGSDRVEGSKVLGARQAGSVFTIDELLDPMITQSDNTAANMLIERLGFDMLNDYFKKIGLKNTNISRKMIDFKERRNGVENYTTANDMAYSLEKLYRKSFLSKEVSAQCITLLGEQKINDRIPKKLPKGTFVAHKTGLERRICHDVGIVFTDNGNFLICVLAKHGGKYALPTKKFISDVTLEVYNYYQNLE